MLESQAGSAVEGGMTRLLAIAALLCAASTHAAEPPGPVRAEVEGLLALLGQSECEFFRNGHWHGSAEAQSHLRMKYEQLVRRGLVRQTEDFIAGAGTKSSLSGEPYRVRCAGQPPRDSAAWLGERLRERRLDRRATRP